MLRNDFQQADEYEESPVTSQHGSPLKPLFFCYLKKNYLRTPLKPSGIIINSWTAHKKTSKHISVLWEVSHDICLPCRDKLSTPYWMQREQRELINKVRNLTEKLRSAPSDERHQLVTEQRRAVSAKLSHENIFTSFPLYAVIWI